MSVHQQEQQLISKTASRFIGLLKAIRHWLPLTICIIVFIIALAACGVGGTMASTTVGGETWSQGAATYAAAVNGQTVPYTLAVLTATHGSNTPRLKAFLIFHPFQRRTVANIDSRLFP